jgi:hypothetical protein
MGVLGEKGHWRQTEIFSKNMDTWNNMAGTKNVYKIYICT